MKPLNRDEAIRKLQVVRHRLREALERFYNHDDLSRNQVALEAAVLDVATPIRVIVHDTEKGSMSLLGQIDPDYENKPIHFSPLKPPPPRTLPTGEQTRSVVIPLNVSLGANKTVFTRYKGCKNPGEKVPLKVWWSEIRWDSGTNQVSNRDIILAITNKEGGAHVDGEVSSKYRSAKDQGQIVVGGRPVNDVVRLGSLAAIAGDELMEYLQEHFPES
jgi:hypothetical protein